jgi:hypothetical protein
VSKCRATEVAALPIKEKSLIAQTKENLQLLKHNLAAQEEFQAAMDGLMFQWWRALTLSDEFAAAQRGERGEPWASVAKDFGQLYGDFGIWWAHRGMNVFARLVHQPTVRKLLPDEPVMRDRIRPTLYLAIPLDLGPQVISRQINQLIDKERETFGLNEGAEQPTTPRNFYADQRLHLPTIAKMLDVYETRTTARLEWWQIGAQHDVSEAARLADSDDADTVKHKRRLMTLATQRLYRMASALIDFAARGDFPRIK